MSTTSQFKDIKEFLAKHTAKAGTGAQFTHTRIGNKELNIYGGAFVIPKDATKTDTLEKECMKTVDNQLGAIARPGRVYVVTALPKTRSGKIVRRALQAVAEGRDPGDISTMEDQSVLAQIKTIIERSAAT